MYIRISTRINLFLLSVPSAVRQQPQTRAVFLSGLVVKGLYHPWINNLDSSSRGCITLELKITYSTFLVFVFRQLSFNNYWIRNKQLNSYVTCRNSFLLIIIAIYIFAKIKIIICIKARGGEHRGGVFRTIAAFKLDMN